MVISKKQVSLCPQTFISNFWQEEYAPNTQNCHDKQAVGFGTKSSFQISSTQNENNHEQKHYIHFKTSTHNFNTDFWYIYRKALYRCYCIIDMIFIVLITSLINYHHKLIFIPISLYAYLVLNQAVTL